MKKQFHYYAIRYLASAMGFRDEVSKLIAELSQFVDDCCTKDVSHSYYKIPQEIIDRKLYEGTGEKLIIPVPKTAFNSDESKVVILDEKEQLNTLVPFHYYPPYVVTKMKDYYVIPIKKIDLDSLLFSIIKDTAERYQFAKDCETMSDKLAGSAIRIGVVTHVIADTYAHRFFNGFTSYINITEILQIQENETMKDIRSEYPGKDVLNTKFNVGCARVGTTVDDVNVVVAFKQKVKEDPLDFMSGGHVVNTSSNYIDAAYMIYKYFAYILKLADDDLIWNGLLCSVITEMSKMRGKTDAEYASFIQRKLDKTIDCNYSAFNTMMYLTDDVNRVSEFALIVDDIRKSATQEKVLSKMTKTLRASDLYNDEGGFDFLPLVMDSTSFNITVKVLFGDIKEGMILHINLFNKTTQQKVLSKSFVCTKQNEIIGSISNDKIPSKKTGYILSASVETDDGSTIHAESKEYNLEDERDLLSMTVTSPVSKVEGVPATVTNNIMPAGDYHFKDNATYISQKNNQMLDLFLPVSMIVEATAQYKIINIIRCQLTLTDCNKNTYLHCGNKKFNKIVIDKSKKSATIKFFREWKNNILCSLYKDAETDMKLIFEIKANLEFTGNDTNIKGIRTVIWNTDTLDKTLFPQVNLIWIADDQV